MSTHENKNQKKEELIEKIDDLDVWVSTAIENGLFCVQDDVSVDNILNKLKDARDDIDIEKKSPLDFSQCDYNLSKAAAYYSQAIASAPLSWRLLNIYAVHLWAYLIVFLSAIFIFYSFNLLSFIKFEQFEIPIVAVHAAAWGIIGGLLRGLWWLWKNVDDRQYRKVWIIWFISTPFLSGILGAIVYFLLFAGLIVISNTQVEDINQVKDINPMLVIVLAALAGFNWDWAVNQFKKIGEKL